MAVLWGGPPQVAEVEEGVEVEVAALSCVGVSSSSTHSKVAEVEVVGVQAWQLQVLLGRWLHCVYWWAVVAAALAVLSR